MTSKQNEREFAYRRDLANGSNYKFSLGIVQVGGISEPSRLVESLAEHLKSYSHGQDFQDKIIPVDNSLYVYMSGSSVQGAYRLSSFFGQGSDPKFPKDLDFECKVGVSQYKQDRQLIELVRIAQAHSVHFKNEVSQVEDLTTTTRKLFTKVG